MANKIHCLGCGSIISFRSWSKRLPVKSEALGDCPECGKVQVRFFNGKQSSEPYKVKPKGEKTVRGSWRMSPERKAAIVVMYGSVQSFLNTAPLVCMPLQYKH